MLIAIDARSGIPLQRQIFDSIRHAILGGTLTPGTRIPSSRAIADDLNVSRTTAILALEQLLAEGYLTTRRGSGTFVSYDLPDEPPPATTIVGPHESRHPPLSSRGRALAATSPPARRVGGPPRAFRIGTPALDRFPVKLWTRLVARRAGGVTRSQLDYSDPAGFAPLREAIASHVSRSRGTRCTADDVIVVAGAQRGVELMCHMLLDPGDTAWLEDPGYPGARSALLSAGACIVPVRVDRDGLDVMAGARAAPSARVVYVSPSHQFPLGVPMTVQRRLALLRWAGEAGAWVLEDDYDSAFRHGVRPVPCLHGLDADRRVVYVGSFSKTLFPALRLGFLLVPPALRDAVLAARRAADVHPALLEQAVIADLIGEGHYERHLRRMRAVYRGRLDALVESAREYCGGALRIRPVRTGLHAVADLDGVDADTVSDLAAARGVEAAPLSMYAIEPGRAPNALVLGFGAVDPDAVRAGARRLADAIEQARRGRATGSADPARSGTSL